ncbi:MAG: hypothetical protein ABIA59_05820, partial [Candidatus Latescibacterota bacterium]
MRKTCFWIFLFVILYLFFEVASLLGLFLLKHLRNYTYSPILASSVSDEHRDILNNLLQGRADYLAHSPTLGWTIKNNGLSGLYRANSQGIRANREYPLTPPADTVRIAAFGDSFTHCDDVGNEDTWQERMNAASEKVEVINFGVGGYGLDQAFLRYQQDGIHFNPHIVFIGFMPENIYRAVNVFRPFYVPATGIPLAKSRFALKDDMLVLLGNPMPTLSDYDDLLARPKAILQGLGAHDYYYQSPAYYKKGPLDFLPSVRLFKIARLALTRISNTGSSNAGGSHYSKDSEALKITLKIFDEFVASATENKSFPIIVLFPDKVDIISYRENGTRKYEPLIEHFEQHGHKYVDTLFAFEQYGKDSAIGELIT